MEKTALDELKNKIVALNEKEKKMRILHQRKLSTGEILGPSTGYSSIDMPWLKYYTEEEILCPIPNMTAYDYLKVLNVENLNKIAINFMEYKITYHEFFTNVENAAKMLKRLGVKKGEVITAILPPSLEEEYLFYAIDKIGAIAHFVITGTPINTICANMNELNSTKLFAFNISQDDVNIVFNTTKTSAIIETLPQKKDNNISNWHTLIEECKNDDPVIQEKSDEDTIFIAKTGGSTGVPKNVLINDKCFNNVIHQYLNSSLPYSAGDKWLRLWPIFHVTSAISGNHLPLCAGMEMILVPYFDFNKIDEIIWEYKPNHLLLVPPLLEIIINSPLLKDKDLSFIKSCGCGGAGMTEDLEKRANKFFQENNLDIFLGCGYGLTENGSVATTRMNKETTKKGSVGVPLVNTTVSVFDVDTNEELGYNEEGEICIKSNNFMKGYLNDQETTNKVIKKHKDETLWIHTGDLGYVNEDGQIYITGRITRTIFLHSAEKVYPDKLEEKLSGIEGVKAMSVIAVSDKKNEGYFVPACCIIREENYTEKQVIENIMKFCSSNVETYAIPREMHFVKTLPLTKIGKVDIPLLEKTYK